MQNPSLWRWLQAQTASIEVHPHPEDALMDGPQSLLPERYRLLVESARELRLLLEGRGLHA